MSDDKAHALDRIQGGDLEEIIRKAAEPFVDRMASIAPLPGGIMNTVFEVTGAHTEPVVVRVAQRPDPHFENERRALDSLRPQGSPVARVLSLEHHHVGEGVISVIVLTKLPGRTLWNELAHLEPATAAAIVSDLGAELALIHAATTHTVTRQERTWRRAELLDHAETLRQGARRGDVQQAHVDAAIDLLADHPSPYGDSACLVHNDFKAEISSSTAAA